MSILIKNILLEPLMSKVTKFLGIERTWYLIFSLIAVSLIHQAIPVVPTVLNFSLD